MSRIDERELLARELRARSAGVGGHPIGFDEVRRSARRIQRRRRAVSGAVAAVVLSIAVPAGLSVSSRVDSAPMPAQTPTAPASPTTPAPVPDGPVTLRLKGLDQGAPPALPYMSPDGLVTPEETLETDIVMHAWERREDGWIRLGYAGSRSVVTFLDEELDPVSSEPSGERMAANADGSMVAWTRIEPDGQTLLSTSGPDETSWSFPATPAVEPVGYVGPDAVVYERLRGETSDAGIAYGDGQTRPIQGFVGVSDASEASGLIAGPTRVDDEGSCSGVMDPAESTTRVVRETCDHSLQQFSPDGRYLLASDPYQSGLGSTSLTVLDARTLEPVVDFQQPRGGQVSLLTIAWESDEAVLAVALEGTTTTIIRLRLDGTVEQAVEPVEGDPFAEAALSLSQSRR
jgi:hypothetical protein